MLVIDEYLAVRVLAGDWPVDLPDTDTLVLPSSRHFRLLQRRTILAEVSCLNCSASSATAATTRS